MSATEGVVTIDNDVTIRIDNDDLENKVWSCKKYTFLHNGVNTHCQQVVDSSTRFRVHIRKFHQNDRFPKLYMCPIKSCSEYNKHFTRIQHLQNHYDCIHRVSQDYACPICKNWYSSRNTWKRHVKDCSAGFVKCDYCEKVFSGNSSLSRHCRTNHIVDLQKKAYEAAGLITPLENVPETEAQKYIVVPIVPLNKIKEQDPKLVSRLLPVQSDPDYYKAHYTAQYPSKRQKQDAWSKEGWPAPPCTSESNWGHVPDKPSASSWDSDTAEKEAPSDWGVHDKPISWPSAEMSSSSNEDWRDKEAGSWVEERLIHDKQLYSALDNITTQTDEFWGFNELSTQTVTEHSSFGTQTGCGDDIIDTFLQECDIVEYLDGAVQTDNCRKVDSASLGSQTSISTERYSNERSCGIDRSDRDCQTSQYKNSTYTQTKMMRERAVIVADGLNSETQTTGPQLQDHQYNESQTQTIDPMSLTFNNL